MVFTAITLAVIIMLTQSLRFLELVISSGASSFSLWILTFLALPRFFEVILPIALMIGTVFIYNRMASDSELVVMRSTGLSPMRIGRPAIILSLITTLILLFITSWLAPVSLSNMQKMRQVIKAQYSTLLFREGVFNPIGDDLTVYISNRNAEGELEGLIIHDSRNELDTPVTIIAKRGVILMEDNTQQVLVFNGSRQNLNEKTGALDRLDFERYSIELPDSGPVRQRWREPDERTLWELLNPDLQNKRDAQNREEFLIEAHRRIVSPFLALNFTVIALSFLLLGPQNRQGQGIKIFSLIMCVIVIQGLYLAAFSLSSQSIWGLIFMDVLVFGPLLFGLYLLSQSGENIRRTLFFHKRQML